MIVEPCKFVPGTVISLDVYPEIQVYSMDGISEVTVVIACDTVNVVSVAVDGTPVESDSDGPVLTPLDGTSLDGTPVDGTPVESESDGPMLTLLDGMPLDGTPVEFVKSDELSDNSV